MGNVQQVVFWHRELPPSGADPAGEFVVEAASHQVQGTLSHRDELWTQCYESLMAQARTRIEQEVSRLAGDFAIKVVRSFESRRRLALQAVAHEREGQPARRRPDCGGAGEELNPPHSNGEVSASYADGGVMLLRSVRP
mgnify:CR=1 FL=1